MLFLFLLLLFVSGLIWLHICYEKGPVVGVYPPPSEGKYLFLQISHVAQLDWKPPSWIPATRGSSSGNTLTQPIGAWEEGWEVVQTGNRSKKEK
jgi:hypothetical protein